jgi:pyridoxine kinase
MPLPAAIVYQMLCVASVCRGRPLDATAAGQHCSKRNQEPMARALAISSLVARGHVGLSAMVPALQAGGHDVTALPTIILSHHPGHPHAAGERVPPATLARMLDGLDANGWLAEIDAVVTGYLPSPEHAELAAAAIDRVRARNRRVVVLVDAVLGDHPKGLYVPAEAAVATREQLVPRADVLKGNAFEIGWLAAHDATNAARAETAIERLARPLVLATSVAAETPERLLNILKPGTASGTGIPRGARVVARPAERREGVPKGTGDLLAGLWLSHALRGHSTDHDTLNVLAAPEALDRALFDLDRIVVASLGADELRVVSAFVGRRSDR